MSYFSDAELTSLANRVDRGEFWSPRIVKFTLLDGCNWRCQMCRCDKTASAPLSVDDWLGIARDVLRMGAKEIAFTGGEPTLFPGFESLVGGVRALDPHVKLKLLTNGTRLTPERVDRLLAHGLRRYIVSLHGDDAATHDAIVGVANQWRKTLRGIESVVRASPGVPRSVWLNCVVRRANLPQLVGVVRLAAALGCEGVSFSPLDGRVADAGERPLTVTEMEAAREAIFPAVRETAQARNVMLFPSDSELFGRTAGEVVRCASGELSRGFYETHPCYWVYYHVTVEPDGTVQPCCNRPLAGGYGNACTSPLDALTTRREARAFLATAGVGPAVFATCRGCEMKLQVNRDIDEGIAALGLTRPAPHSARRALPIVRGGS
ncbi:MAG: radical SAM protein [Polyangiales bacterium]